jgi:SAM-dependent methyltransferase
MGRERQRAETRARRLAAELPRPAKRAAQLALSAVDPVARTRYRRRTGTREPIPPIALRARVGTPGIAAFMRAHAGYAEQAARAAGRSLDSFRSILDFGCGCGRTLVPLARRLGSEAEVCGCDIDAEAIQWLQTHHPQLRLRVTGAEPPLPYEPGSFDLVISVSVFTHLDEPRQDAWLAELRRVLRDDGLGALTVHGERAYRSFARGEAPPSVRSASERIASHGSMEDAGFIFEPAEPSRWNALRSMESREGWGLAFHSRDYLRERWGRFFSRVRVIEGPTQDIALVWP